MTKTRGINQQKILDYIKTEINEKGYPPSVREIAEAVGLKSTSTVHGHLQRLEKRGLIHRNPMKPRAMEICGEPPAPKAQSTLIPLVGNVQAGLPILAEEYAEDYFQIPDAMLSSGEHFILRVHGNSMINIGILDGDYVVVRKQSVAHNGDVVVARLEDSATVKTFYAENGRFRLQPENDEMLPIFTDRVDIEGIVVSLFRKMR